MSVERYDFIVVGSGVAGLTFALHAAEHGRVAVLTKGDMQESNTYYAQGGIAAAVGEADSWQLHEQDTLAAGAGLNDREAVRFLVQQAPSAIQWLRDLGANFDLSPDREKLALGREGGHSRNRIVHSADHTGSEIETTLVRATKAHPAIDVYEQAFSYALLSSDRACAGVAARVEGLGVKAFAAPAVMLATGGCGRLYQHTTNPSVATGDGIALGQSLDADIRDMEFMQFHPTTLYHPQLRSFLISEAVRGAGATLRNHLGERFMYDYHSSLELAPRDIVSRAIDSEMKRLGTWCVYLDAAHLPMRALRSEFPTIYQNLESVGILLHKHWIPVVPAQHYSCGGVVADLEGRTSIPGLYAAGEVACSGIHGANRLASNSLLEGLVFGRSAALWAASEERGDTQEPQTPVLPPCVAESAAVRIRRSLQRTMTEHVGIVRTFDRLEKAQSAVDELIHEYESLPKAAFSPYSVETHNLLKVGRLVIEGARRRRENVGLHFNADLATASSPRKREEALGPAEGEPK
jgi:L-aspartate oxidase